MSGEETRVPGTRIKNESPPNQGVTIRSKDAKELKEGQTVYVISKGPNEVAAVETPYKLVKVGDQLVLQAIEGTPKDAEQRRNLARSIVAAHRQEIMDEAVAATEEALARKPLEKLEKMEAAGKKGGKAKMASKKGCVFLTIGEEETVL